MDDDSDQEYEKIELTGKGGVKGQWSPGKRPPIPIPNNQGPPLPAPNPQRGSNPYSVGEEGLSALRRAQSLQESKSNVPPPLPPLNMKQRQRGSPVTQPRAKAPPPPLKPRSMTVGEVPEPPVIPPKPGPKTIPFVPEPSRTVTPPKRRIEDDFILENDELNPKEFVSKFRDEFPLYVRVSKGFYGNSERTSVSEGDTFNIHFIKNAKVVAMEDGGGGTFKIGLNSGIQFGLLFDPNDKRDEAMTGFTFDKISDMLQLKLPPKVVRVGASWRGPNHESTVDINSLLIFKGWKRKLSSRVMKAYDLNTKEKKELPENCQGKFSTRPYDTRLFLSDLIENVPHPLPSSAILYMNTDLCDFTELPSTLTASVLRLKALCTETTLIATGAHMEDFDETEAVEIPFDLDIEFQVMRPKAEKDTEDLYQSTRKLLENYTKLKTPHLLGGGQEGGSDAQAALYSIVREGRELAGVDIVKPAAIYMNTSSPKKAITSTKSANAPFRMSKKSKHLGSETLYDECDVDGGEQFDALHTRIDRLEKELLQLKQKVDSLGNVEGMGDKVSKEVTAARADMRRLEMRCNKAGEDAAKSKADTAYLRPIIEQLTEICESMQGDIKSLKQQVGPQGAASPAPKGYMALSHTATIATAEALYSEASCEANKIFLASLDCAQVLSLLESMGLSQHQTAFMEERVNGEILLECDDRVLQEELKITSKLQRVRLSKVIQGKHSAENIFNGEDPYAYARPK